MNTHSPQKIPQSGIPKETFHEVDLKPWGRLAPAIWFQKNLTNFVYSPAHIVSSAVDYGSEPAPGDRGVYFLLESDEVIYVGQTNNINRRLLEHRRDGILFDRFWCFGGVPKMFIKEIENLYIKLFNPACNLRQFTPLRKLMPFACPARYWS